jgi:hypothetical protein
MEDSWRIGNAELVHWVEELYGLTSMDAYQLSLADRRWRRSRNVVDANYSVVVKAAKNCCRRDAFDGMHDELRARARSLVPCETAVTPHLRKGTF